MSERYFLDQDRDCHWYVVPVSLKKEWDVWNELDIETEEAWTPPEGVKEVGGWPGSVTFTDPNIQ